MADVVIDATGDGDLFARAGAAFDSDIDAADIHHCMNTPWLFGGVDMQRWLAFRAHEPERYAAFMQAGRDTCGLFDKPFVSWRDDIALFLGPRQSGYSALDVDELTAVELRSRRAMAAHLEHYRAQAPGFENAYILQSAAQIGVRHARRLKGAASVLRARWPEGVALADEIGVSPGVSRPSSRTSPSPTVPWCPSRSMVCWPVAVTCRVTPTRMASCARSRSAG